MPPIVHLRVTAAAQCNQILKNVVLWVSVDVVDDKTAHTWIALDAAEPASVRIAIQDLITESAKSVETPPLAHVDLSISGFPKCTGSGIDALAIPFEVGGLSSLLSLTGLGLRAWPAIAAVAVALKPNLACFTGLLDHSSILPSLFRGR